MWFYSEFYWSTWLGHLFCLRGEGHSLYHLQELKKKKLSKLNIDSNLAPLINVDIHTLEIFKSSCKKVVAMRFQETLIDLSISTSYLIRSRPLILFLPFLRWFLIICTVYFSTVSLLKKISLKKIGTLKNIYIAHFSMQLTHSPCNFNISLL